MKWQNSKVLCCSALLAALANGCSKQDATVTTPSSHATPSYFRVDPSSAGSIHGSIRFEGPRASARVIDMTEDPACVRAHQGKAQDDSLVVGARGGLANVFVYVEKGLEGKKFETPLAAVVVNQQGCWFHPRVLGIQTGQRMQIVNSDPVTHNIHPLANVNREWNHSQGPGDAPIQRSFPKPEVMIAVKCNIHSWMKSYIGVVDHPYFAVTTNDGAFDIANLPPGTYTLTAWQERIGSQHATVIVPPHGSTNASFVYRMKQP